MLYFLLGMAVMFIVASFHHKWYVNKQQTVINNFIRYIEKETKLEP